VAHSKLAIFRRRLFAFVSALSLLLCLAATGAQYRNPWLLTAIALMLPRIAIQLAPQMLGVIRWLASPLTLLF